jgi:hypothetical protein
MALSLNHRGIRRFLRCRHRRSLAVLRWAFSIRRGRGGRLVQSLSCVVIAVAAISIARRDAWWQLDYARRGVSFTMANELHVPAGVAIRLA